MKSAFNLSAYLILVLLIPACLQAPVNQVFEWHLEPSEGREDVQVTSAHIYRDTAIVVYSEMEKGINDEGKFETGRRGMVSFTDLSGDGSGTRAISSPGYFRDMMKISGETLYSVMYSPGRPVYFVKAGLDRLLERDDYNTVNLTNRLGKLLLGDLVVSGDYVYISDMRQGGIICIDCSDEDRARFRQFYKPAGQAYSDEYRFKHLAADGTTVYAINTSDYYLYTMDFSDMKNPAIVSVNTEYTIMDLVLSGGYIYASYIADDDRGIAVYLCGEGGTPELVLSVSAPIPESVSQLETDGFKLYSLLDTGHITSGIIIFDILEPMQLHPVGRFNPGTYGGFSVANGRLAVPAGSDRVRLYELNL
jgi:hypothetical protein